MTAISSKYSILTRNGRSVVYSTIYRRKPTAIIGDVSSDICVQFGNRLRTLRKQRGWTQVYMSEHVGLDRSFISDLENGKKEVCIRNLELLAKAFGLTVAQILAHL